MNVQAVEWYLARGSGFAAFVLLTASMAAGLALSLRLTSPRWPAVVTNDTHRWLTTLALWLTGIHLLMLLIDPESGFGVADLLVPFAAEYRPVATSLGILGMYAVVAVAVSTRLRARIGYRRWRQIHGLAFVAYVAALFHGLFGGTDTGEGWATLVYLGSAALVGGLTLLRVLRPRPVRPAGGGAPAAARATPQASAPAKARVGSDLPPLGPRPDLSRGELPPLRR